MGNLGKKILGTAALGAAAGAAAYYFVKKKNEDPDLQEEFADFQDNVKETATSAVNVASRFKEALGKSVDNAVNKVKEHTDDFIDDDIFEEGELKDSVESIKKSAKETAENIKNTVEKAEEKIKDTITEADEEKEE